MSFYIKKIPGKDTYCIWFYKTFTLSDFFLYFTEKLVSLSRRILNNILLSKLNPNKTNHILFLTWTTRGPNSRKAFFVEL